MTMNMVCSMWNDIVNWVNGWSSGLYLAVLCICSIIALMSIMRMLFWTYNRGDQRFHIGFVILAAIAIAIVIVVSMARN